MSIQAFQISLKLEILLHKIHPAFKDKQEEIRCDPYSAIEKALSFYIADNPSIKNELLNLLSDFNSFSGKSVDKILENDGEKKMFLESIKNLKRLQENLRSKL